MIRELIEVLAKQGMIHYGDLTFKWVLWAGVVIIGAVIVYKIGEANGSN